MHLGYHELRQMLEQFKEARSKRHAPSSMAHSGPPPGGMPPSGPRPDRDNGYGSRSGSDYRSSRDDRYDRDRGGYDRGEGHRDRERDRGYSSRYEYVVNLLFPAKKINRLAPTVIGEETVNARGHLNDDISFVVCISSEPTCSMLFYVLSYSGIAASIAITLFAADWVLFWLIVRTTVLNTEVAAEV